MIYDLFKGESKKSLTAEILGIVKDHLDLFRETDKSAWYCVPEPAKKPLPDNLKYTITDPLSAACEAAAVSLKCDALGKAGQKIIDAYNNPMRTDVTDSGTLFTNVYFNGQAKYSKKTVPADVVDTLKNLGDDVKYWFLGILKRQTEAAYSIIAEIASRLENIKSATGEYTFDDIPYYLDQTIQKIQNERFDFRLDGTISHLLLDEFQDTSIFQWKILEPIADSVACADSNNPQTSFFCVGDTKQSIYQWRGGVPEIFDTIEKKYGGSIDLFENWRSSSVVLNVVNQVFKTVAANKCLCVSQKAESGYETEKGLTKQSAAQKWQSVYKEHVCAGCNAGLSGFVSLEALPLLQNLPTDRLTEFGIEASDLLELESKRDAQAEEKDKDKKKKLRLEADSLERELKKELRYSYITNRIKKLHREKPEASIGVLFRTGKQLAEIAGRLKARGIEISQEGGNPLAIAESVRAILALLRIAEHPNDAAALFRAATLPEMEEILPDDVRPNLERFTEKRYLARAGVNISLHIRKRMMTGGLGVFVQEAADKLLAHCDTSEREKLHAFVNSAFLFEKQQGARADQFIHYTEVNGVSLPGDSNIHLSTIHAAKGLEYDIVVLPELSGSEIVSSKAKSLMYKRPGSSHDPAIPDVTAAPDMVFRYADQGELPLLPQDFFTAYKQSWRSDTNGSLNLLYVAMTRARRELVMIIDPIKVKDDGTLDESSASDFGNLLLTQLEPLEKRGNYRPFDIGEEIIYQDGDPDWYTNDQTNRKTAQLQAESADPPLVSVRKNPIDFNSAEEVRAPSDHGFQRQWFPSRQLFDRGTAIHACFEQIEWLDGAVPSREELRKHLTENVFRGQKAPLGMDDLLDGFMKLCEDPTVKKVLSSSFYAGSADELKVWRERPYIAVSPAKPGRELGIIDRLVVRRVNGKAVAADIIDYKTNSSVPKDPDKLRAFVEREHYDEQLNKYRREVEKMYNIQGKVTARLLFTDCQKDETTGEIKPIVRLFDVQP